MEKTKMKGMKGSKEIISGIFILFLVGLFTGIFVYMLGELKTSLNDTQATTVIDEVVGVFGTVANLLGPYAIMIVIGAIAAVAIGLYYYFRGAVSG
ncbi:MAG: hypothetical protein QXJ14_02715 [Candidatus Aenigmatarchaeota archaeon]